MFGSGDGGKNKIILILISLCFFFSLFTFPAYAFENSDNITSKVENVSIYKNTLGNLAFKFKYNGTSYDIPSTYAIDSVSGLNFLVIDSKPRYSDTDCLIFLVNSGNICTIEAGNDDKAYYIPSTYEKPLRFDVMLQFNDCDLINGWGFTEYFTFSMFGVLKVSTVDLKRSDGSVFFYRIPPLVTAPMMEGVLAQVLAMTPTVLLLIVLYLALRKCLNLLFNLLKTS